MTGKVMVEQMEMHNETIDNKKEKVDTHFFKKFM